VEDKSWGRMSVKWSVQNKTKDQTSGSVKEEEEEDSQPLKSLAFSSLDGVGRVGPALLYLALPYVTLRSREASHIRVSFHNASPGGLSGIYFHTNISLALSI